MQQLFDLRGIGSQAPQHGRRLKGAFSGADIEEFGIQADACQQALGLNGQHILLFHHILQQFRHQFRCRGGVSLVEVDHHGVNIIGGSAVVIHHADLGDRLQQRLVFHLIRAVGIHHHQDAAGVAVEHGLLTGQEHIFVFRHLPDLLNQLLGSIVFQVDDNAGLLAPLPAQAADAHGSTNGVQVCAFMTHDVHPAALADELHQGVGCDTGAHLAPVVRFLAAAAVEGKVDAVLDHRLVTAPAQGHFNAQGRKIIGFLKVHRIHTQTQGNGGRQAGGVGNLMDGFQQGKLVLNGVGQIPLFKDKQKPAALQLPQQTAVALCPFGDGVVELGVHGGDTAFAEVADQLLIVVNEDNGHHRTGTDILVPHLVQLCQVAEVHHPQHGAAAVLGPDHRAVDPVAAILDGGIVGTFGFAGSQPIRGEVGKYLPQLMLHHGIGNAGQAAETVICPNNAPVCQPNHHRGEGIGTLADGLHRFREGAQIFF